jgi:signal transduction histidine kinase
MRSSKQYNKGITLLGAILITFSLILSISIIVVKTLFFGQSAQKVALENALQKTQERESVIKEFLNASTHELLAIRDSSFFRQYLTHKNNTESISEFFLRLSQSHPYFFQIRYIDKQGDEKIRIDRKAYNAPPFIVPNQALQNKAQRYYFADSKQKPREQVWFSAIDLNIERGAIEKPFNPTLRAVLPIQIDNEFGGILIINYFMDHFIKKLTYAPLYDMILFNDKGETLIHYKGIETSWGNTCDHHYTIARDFPHTYQKILTTPILKTDDFVSRKLEVPIYGGITILLTLKEAYLIKEQQRSRHEYILISIIIFLFSLLLTFFIIKIFSTTLLNLDQVQRLNNNLNSLQMRNDIALRASEIGIWEWDHQTNTLLWDNQMYRMYGVTKESAPSAYTLWKDAIGSEKMKELEDTLQTTIKNHSEYTHSFWITTPQGERRYISLFGIHEYDENEVVIRTVGTNQDITPLKLTEEKLHNLVEIETAKRLEKERLLIEQSKLAAMGEMIGAIAHQWRQPLNALSIGIQNLKYDYEDNLINREFLTTYIAKNKKTIAFMSQTIDGFRNFFRTDKEQVLLDIKNEIESVLTLLSAQLKQHRIQVTLTGESFSSTGFQTEFKQVIINILNNAKDALIEKKSKAPSITIHIDNHTRSISLQDNAGGIPHAIIDRIFEPYFTTKEEGKGTGIGLYLSKIIVENMNGTLQVENREHGACFLILLPKE